MTYFSNSHGEDKGIFGEINIRKMASGVHIKNEVDRYLTEPDEDREKSVFDVLDWWKVYSSKYKVLSLFALDVLGIPLSMLLRSPLLTPKYVFWIYIEFHPLQRW